MEGLHCLKFLLEQNDFLCKTDIEDAYVAIPLSKRSLRVIMRQPLRVSLPLFWFLVSSKSFYQITKNPNCSFVYLDDMLLMGRTLREIMTAMDTLIFLLQNLGFVINLKKLILQPAKQLEFLVLQMNTEKMTVSLSEEKLTHIIQQC